MKIQQKVKRGISSYIIKGFIFVAILTAILRGPSFYFNAMQRKEVHDHLSQEQTKTELTFLVKEIEDYKIHKGHYPKSLETLKKSLPKDSPIFVYDPSNGSKRYFYYEVVNPEHYYLLGVGPDGQPFTADDIIPEIPANFQNKSGLLIKK